MDTNPKAALKRMAQFLKIDKKVENDDLINASLSEENEDIVTETLPVKASDDSIKERYSVDEEELIRERFASLLAKESELNNQNPEMDQPLLKDEVLDTPVFLASHAETPLSNESILNEQNLNPMIRALEKSENLVNEELNKENLITVVPANSISSYSEKNAEDFIEDEDGVIVIKPSKVTSILEHKVDSIDENVLQRIEKVEEKENQLYNNLHINRQTEGYSKIQFTPIQGEPFIRFFSLDYRAIIMAIEEELDFMNYIELTDVKGEVIHIDNETFSAVQIVDPVNKMIKIS